MKKGFSYLLATLLILVFSCKKDDPAPVLPSAPEALAEHDNKSGGIYRGTIANASNSGSFTINLQNGKKEITVKINNIARTLTTDDLNAWTSGEPAAATFSNGSWAVQIDLNATGSNMIILFSIDGVTTFNGAFAKELSTTQVKVYEGTFAGTDSGRWNFIRHGNEISGVYFSISNNDNFTGVVTGNDISIDSSVIAAIGTFAADGNTASGTWTGIPVTIHGTWTGNRTL